MDKSRAFTAPDGLNPVILYVDFDGVLHHENVIWHPTKGPVLHAPPSHRLFQHVDLLTEVIEPYPQLKIVLSTSWVLRHGYLRTANRLPLSLRNRVIGATFHSQMDKHLFRQSPRGMQVWADAIRRRPRDWLAIDDDYLHWPAWCRDKYIRTDEQLGISAPNVLREFRSKLKQAFCFR